MRALIWTPQNGKNDVVNSKKNKFKGIFGLYVPVNIDRLIEIIYVAPNAPKWILELTKKVIEKFELKIIVTQPSLTSTPLY